MSERLPLRRAIFGGAMVLFALLAVSALDGWLESRSAPSLLALAGSAAGAGGATVAFLRLASSRRARAAAAAFVSALLLLALLDVACAAVGDAASTPMAPPEAELVSRDSLAAWARAQPRLELLLDVPELTVLGERQGWAGRWRAVRPTGACAIRLLFALTAAGRAALGVPQEARCPEIAARLAARWPGRVFTVIVWRAGAPGVSAGFDDDNRLGDAGVYPPSPLLRDLLSPASLLDRARSYRNLLRFAVGGPPL